MNDKIAFYGEGFPRAITFLFNLQKTDVLTAPQVDEVLAKIEEYPSLRGKNLDFFYSVLCDNDVLRAHTVLTDENVTEAVLISAFEAGDTSGAEIIQDAINP